MKNIIAYAVASAALASAQVTSNPDGTFTCATADKNYCAGNSLGTDIIIRCSGTKGQPGRCSDNLAGEPPVGVQPALCWQSSPTSGDAACEKNCIVYAATGSFSLPNCTPTYTASTSSSTTSTTSTSSVTVTTTTTATTWGPGGGGWTSGYPHGSFTHPNPYNTTWTSMELSTSTTGVPTTPPATTTTSKTTSVPTAGAASNGAAGALAVIGAVAAYLL